MKVKIFLFLFLIISSIPSAQNNIPNWAKGIVWYQIFPERFANGDSTNDPEPEKVFVSADSIPKGWKIRKWTSNWFEQDEWEKKLGGNFNDNIYQRRYGGDIKGIIDKLDYLEELGIGAIYLNPVFEAPSLHKYDGSSFHHIDVNFGPDPCGDRKILKSEKPDDPRTWKWTKADMLFLELIDEVHKRKMKIIIDGVFNHTGTEFWAFKDLVKNGINSVYSDWYIVKSFDDTSTTENEFDYKGWWGVKSLPELNRTENDLIIGPKRYIFASTEKWMDPNGDGDPSDGIDGWRLDVAREIPLGFWNDWSKLVKTLNPNSVVIGELWELSPDFVFEHGPFDALMNYNFAFAVNDFFIAQKNKIRVSKFVEYLMEIPETYPTENLHILQNLVDSHDTDRISSMVKNPDRKYDRDAKEGNSNYDPGKPSFEDYNLQKLIFAFQITYQGAPMIYYGDEVGMWGADDPHCRKPMIWYNLKYDDEVITKDNGFENGSGSYKVRPNSDLLRFYKKMINIRHRNLALQKGDLNFLYVNDVKKSFVFERNYFDEKNIIAFNLGNEENSIEIPVYIPEGKYLEYITDSENFLYSDGVNSKIEIKIPAQSVRIYQITPTHFHLFK
jgi:glycosidase